MGAEIEAARLVPPSSAEPTTTVPADGRAARTARTRQSIVDALLSLLEEGDLQPTATRIAERAGISLRLIYHHFGDLESLFHATSERQAERIGSMVVRIDPGLPLADRIVAFCTQRARILEAMAPVSRAAMLHEPFSDELQRVRRRYIRVGEREIEELFANELAALPANERPLALANLQVAASWNSWDYLVAAGWTSASVGAAMIHAFTVLLRG